MQDRKAYVELQTAWIMSSGGVPLAQAYRVVERDTRENKIRVAFQKGISPDDRQEIAGVLSKNINMFGKGEGGGIHWHVFAKGTLEQWVFGIIELEKRGYRLRRDDSTRGHTRDFARMYGISTTKTENRAEAAG